MPCSGSPSRCSGAGSGPGRSTRRPSPATCPSRTCPTSTSSCGARGSSARATSCCGRARTPRWSSRTPCGPTTTAATCGRRSRSTPSATAATAARWTSRRAESAGAVGAGAEDLQRVVHFGEAVLGADPGRPRLDGAALDLDRAAAVAAHQVVVVTCRARAVDGLTVVGAQHVDLAVGGHGLQVAVDGGEADLVAAGPQERVQLLGRAELAGAGEQRSDGRSLPCRSARRLDALRRRGAVLDPGHRGAASFGSWPPAAGSWSFVLLVVASG